MLPVDGIACVRKPVKLERCEFMNSAALVEWEDRLKGEPESQQQRC